MKKVYLFLAITVLGAAPFALCYFYRDLYRIMNNSYVNKGNFMSGLAAPIIWGVIVGIFGCLLYFIVNYIIRNSKWGLQISILLLFIYPLCYVGCIIVLLVAFYVIELETYTGGIVNWIISTSRCTAIITTYSILLAFQSFISFYSKKREQNQRKKF